MTRIIKYYLLPESGYEGEYEYKESHYKIKHGTVAEMIHDSMILWGSDFDKQIPSYVALNKLLLEGEYLRVVEWDPFELSTQEYQEVVDELMKISMNRTYKIG